jgi:hypothetical protein
MLRNLIAPFAATVQYLFVGTGAFLFYSHGQYGQSENPSAVSFGLDCKVIDRKLTATLFSLSLSSLYKSTPQLYL